MSKAKKSVPRKKDLYMQCVLSKGSMSHTAWIPCKFAKKDKAVRIKKLSGVWNVDKVYNEVAKPEEEVRARSQDYKNTRKVSDIASDPNRGKQ